MGKCPFNGNACSEECALHDVRSKRCVFFTVADVLTMAADYAHEAITSSIEEKPSFATPSLRIKWYRRQVEERVARDEAHMNAQMDEFVRRNSYVDYDHG